MTLQLFAQFYSMTVLSIALIIMGITLIKIIRETKIKNGLIVLRRLLLADGLSTFLLIFLALVIISVRLIFNQENVRTYSYFLLIILTTDVLIKSIVKYRIYSLSYSPQQKDMHKRIQEEEDTKEIVRGVNKRRTARRYKKKQERKLKIK